MCCLSSVCGVRAALEDVPRVGSAGRAPSSFPSSSSSSSEASSAASGAASAAAASGALSNGAGAGDLSPPNAFASFADLSPSDIDEIANRLSSLAGSDVLKTLAGQVNPGEAGLDVGFIQRAVQLLGTALSAPGLRELLAQGGKDAEAVLHALLESQGVEHGSEEEEALFAIFTYFSSLTQVLQENPYLRSQVGDLIQRQAEKFLTDGDFSRVLENIAGSSVFMDLKDEVDDHLQLSAGYVPMQEDGGDMA